VRDLHRTTTRRPLRTAAAVLVLALALALAATVLLTAGHPAAAAEHPRRTDDALPTAPQVLPGSRAAVLAPIAAGLLLTGLAAYRRRGLPGGH
jgi:hypothetical protein